LYFELKLGKIEHNESFAFMKSSVFHDNLYMGQNDKGASV